MILLAAALAMASHGQTINDMRNLRRVLVISAPNDGDARRIEQSKLLRDAATSLAERDVSVVQVTAERVTGALDDVPSIRRNWHLKPSTFTVLLIGKDGHEALRRASPIDAATLIAAIDAMPMRRAGLR